MGELNGYGLGNTGHVELKVRVRRAVRRRRAALVVAVVSGLLGGAAFGALLLAAIGQITL